MRDSTSHIYVTFRDGERTKHVPSRDILTCSEHGEYPAEDGCHGCEMEHAARYFPRGLTLK